jgi:cell wall-associated NlpC family hydrolase
VLGRLRVSAPARGTRTLSTAALAAVVAAGALALATPASAATNTPQSTMTPASQQVKAGERALFGGSLTFGGRALTGDTVRFYRIAADGQRAGLGGTTVNSYGHWLWRVTVTASETVEAVTGAIDGAASTEHRGAVEVADSETLGQRAVSDVSRLAGAPYEYGAAGPSAFDCSGLVQYVYHELGVALPRTAASQYGDVEHIAASQMVPGDLIFFADSSGIYHVGIYAGDDALWHAPHTGTYVQRNQLWTSDFMVGRVR